MVVSLSGVGSRRRGNDRAEGFVDEEIENHNSQERFTYTHARPLHPQVRVRVLRYGLDCML
jgi:hypothetical protein